MRKTKKISFLIFWVVLISIIGAISSQQCNETGYFEPWKTYDTNRRQILTSLASKVVDHYGFYNSSIGKVPDEVHVMGMCIDGTEPTVCSDCLKVAADQLQENCPNQTEAYTWTPHKTLCFARYSNSSFFKRVGLHPLYMEHSNVDIKSNLTYLNTIWEALTDRLMSDASSDYNASLSSRRYYAANVTNLTNFQNIYALMLCTPDLEKGACHNCLEKAVSEYGNLRMQRGIVAWPSCCFRWDLYPFIGAFNLTLSPPPGSKRNISVGFFVAIVVATGVVISVLSTLVVVLVCRKRKTDPPEESPKYSLQYDLKTIEAATCTFSKCNMLGQGGFGEVFKGVLQDGSEIAVKRLSKESAQGVQEFQNETSLVAKLQHRNLVGVLGFCMEGEEKILVYEFVPNKSLDQFLFEPTKKGQLDWAKRYKIIVGTARGILYLHHDSPLKIIHRDLKASNILLDAEMEPKVADFGMARIFRVDQSRADTRRVVGTHGYISPEYLMHGQFSVKSDVYSFGVLVLEIISGKRNSNFHETDESGKNLVTYAWRHWRNGSPLELVDSELEKNYQSNEVFRCIHIALLCVQNDPEQRPNLSTIIMMLTSNSITLPVPQSPVYEGMDMFLPSIKSLPGSVNDSLIDDLVPR
ncbi:serine/threonine kinase-like protein [Arabidopsis thaliana]|uniref:Putative cysteine-rich receptor-like protein kinase 33 n=1 Tax=Arabidopsis thaliana TaxID=3702 RepID=CRK33_ARATH|nr:cysteine-rich RLK (RECEPTOR-like protein kinase) 33 [Arabidopsis thaliana]Q9LDN1.1 RecName: Full=Putative cysteine-rich receptor-like protein kinase 33; Short=Cysteine-rich RLK33; Flags: Precursor [Arabidopsis thaliana]AEE83018.1 cysteine-rich RLK (RECEPTOR-like protein kinase) 33 [Arabidopsis thaliana]CAB78192.1 serine/threonine kinase-like protein [Arabidopsis thaliana]CAB82154.1 serine/threonine kinase-like protein [Arabidopsis thaliana]|eukprot:NP_192888.1 cysteine-rich RLK (RECEPTOR-like protein kinase) 33 [Arabidopsis thaliana]